MTKLKTLSAIALLSVLLTACDKPTETTVNVANTAPAVQTKTEQETAPSNQEKTDIEFELSSETPKMEFTLTNNSKIKFVVKDIKLYKLNCHNHFFFFCLRLSIYQNIIFHTRV